MLKINLLPPSIAQKRQMRVAIAVVILLVAAEVGGLVAARIPKQKLHADLLSQQQDAQTQLTALQKVGSDANAVIAEENKLKPKYDFITGMLKYNAALPSLYQQTAGYTYKEIMFLTLEAAGRELKFDAYASKPTDVGRMLIGLNNSGLFTAIPTVSALPAWSEAAERARKQAEVQASSPASEVIGGVNPTATAGALGPGAPGAGGYPGGGGGYPGGGGPMMASGATGSGGYPGGGGGGGGYPGGGGGGGYPGGGGGAGGNGGDMGVLNIAAARRPPLGFKITVTGQLKESTPRPSYGSSDQQAGQSNGGGGGGGGGYPGGGGGGYPGGGGGGYPGGGGGYPGGRGGYPGG